MGKDDKAARTSAEDRFKPIGFIRTDFPEKFGIPRQGTVVSSLKGKVVFEPEFRNPDMFKGLEDFSHIWLIWLFSKNLDEDGRARWSPTVRPPRLGGNKRMGVFATRSPFRPNPLGLSAVKLERVEYTAEEGPVLYVSGADMVDGTPVYDVKPYVPYADSIEDATGGFTDTTDFNKLEVVWGVETDDIVRKDKKTFAQVKDNVELILANDPRPHYHNDPERVYVLGYGGFEIKFKVADGVLTVVEIKVVT